MCDQHQTCVKDQHLDTEPNVTRPQWIQQMSPPQSIMCLVSSGNFTTSFNCQVNFVTELDLPTDVNIHQDIYIHHYLCDNVRTVCVTPNLYDTLLLYVYLYILFP